MKRNLFVAALLFATAAHTAPFPQDVQSESASKTPHYLQKTITIASGQMKEGIEIPARNVPVHMMVSVPTFGDRGVGEVTISHVGPENPFLMWVGIDTATNGDTTPAKITANAGPASAGVHVVYADNAKLVDVQVDTTNSLRIENAGKSSVKVVITFTW